MPRISKQIVTGALAAALAAVLAVPLGAQQQEDGDEPADITEIIWVDVAPAQHAAFEEGVKAHHENVAAQGSDDPVIIWEIVTGKHSDSYLVGLPQEGWADIGETTAEDPEALSESLHEHVMPHVRSTRLQFWRHHSDLSYQPGGEGEADNTLSTVTFFHLKGGETDAFVDAVEEYRKTAQEADYEEAHWSVHSLEYGGGPVWALVSDHEGWGDLAEPEETLGQVFDEMHSEYEVDAMGEQLDEAIDHAHTEILYYREDLSYSPGSGEEE